MAETGFYEADVIIGTPICRAASFVLHRFLSNQQEIQQAYAGCALVLATDEPAYVAELAEQMELYRLRGCAIAYETVKPDYARNRVWSIAAGRESLRRYTLSRGAKYLLFLDGDMVFEPSVVSIMKSRSQGYDAVFSGYGLPRWGGWGFGGGCVLINSQTLSKITFRCYEFKNGRVICEDEVLDADLFRCRARVIKGIFVPIKHYRDRTEYIATEPRQIGWLRTLTNLLPVRYALIKLCILTRSDLAGALHRVFFSNSHGRKRT